MRRNFSTGFRADEIAKSDKFPNDIRYNFAVNLYIERIHVIFVLLLSAPWIPYRHIFPPEFLFQFSLAH